MTNSNLLVAVLSAGGVQSQAVVSALKWRGASVRPVTRSSGDAVADLSDRKALAAALEGVDVVALTLPLDYSPKATRYAPNVAWAASQAGVQHVVFNANTRIPTQQTPCVGFESRRLAVSDLRSGKVPVTVVEPTMYLENLLAPGVLSGDGRERVLRYPIRSSLPVSWTCVTDLAQTVAHACVSDHSAGPIWPGAPACTGNELAAILGEAMSAEITFEPLDPGLFEQGLAQVLGHESASGVASQYRWLWGRPDCTIMAGGLDGWTGAWPKPTPIRVWARAQQAPAPS